MEGYKEGDGVVSLAFGKYYATSRMERGLRQGRCAKNETGWEGQLHNLQGPLQNENVGCFFKKQEKSVIQGT